MSEEKRSVLVIDDSPTVRRLAELVLTQAGYNVFTASDGDEGLEIAKKEHPSIILVDFIMPKMNGYKLCKIIRSDPELKDIPLILITAKGEDVAQTFDEKFGILHYFQKPFEPDELVEKIDEVLGLEKEKAEAKPSEEIEPEAMIERIDRLLRYYFQNELKVLLKNVMIEAMRDVEIARSTGIILSGELREISIADVMQFIGMTGLSGKLSVVTKALSGEIYFERGQIVFATAAKQGYRRFLSDYIIEDGKINPVQLKESLAIAKQKGLPIGRVLVQEGYITEDELMGYLKQMATDAVDIILMAEEGHFYLEDAPLPMSLSDIKFRVPTSSIILDGLRKLDESKVAAKVFASNDIVPVRLISNVEALEDITLDERELRVFSFVDGKSTLADIIAKSRMDELEVKRVCY
ncbi:MAG: response regulator, partial [Nitrospirae bacterium]